MENKIQMDDMAKFRENLMRIIAFTPEPEIQEIPPISLENLQSSDAEVKLPNQTSRRDSDIDNFTSSMGTELAEANLDENHSDESVASEQTMMHDGQENQNNNLLQSRRLFIAKVIYVTLVGLATIFAFGLLIYFFTKGKKKYISYRESAIDEDAVTEKN